MTLPSTVRSRITPNRSWAPPGPRAEFPVMTSSKIRSAPASAVISTTSASRKPGGGGTTPIFTATGSTMTQATSSACTARRTPSTSPHGTATVSPGTLGHARAVGEPERGHAGAGPGQHQVGMPVVAALELHHRAGSR